MTQGFHQLKVAKTVQETADAMTFYFEIPEAIKETFHYTAGQYLTFETEIKGEKVRRSYSLCTDPSQDPMPAVTVKRVDDGRMSNWMIDNLKAGSPVDVMAPNGKFTVLPQSARSTHYILFAGGSGITPMMGITKAVLKNEPQSKVSLVYANRNPDSVIFKTTLEAMEKEFSDRFKVYHNYDKAPFTWFGMKGFLTEDKVQNLLKTKIGGSVSDFGYYICGPSPMMDIVKKGLLSSGIAKENIHNEFFGAPVTDKPEQKPEDIPAAFDGVAEVAVTVYGKTSTINCDKNTTILNAAIKKGLEPPYSCTVGVCTTCRAKVFKGEVYMMEREGLTDDEIEQGYVLTCQSLPRSAEIELRYE